MSELSTRQPSARKPASSRAGASRKQPRERAPVVSVEEVDSIAHDAPPEPESESGDNATMDADGRARELADWTHQKNVRRSEAAETAIEEARAQNRVAATLPKAR